MIQWSLTNTLRFFGGRKTSIISHRNAIQNMLPKLPAQSDIKQLGAVQRKFWGTHQIPQIAERYSFLPRFNEQKIISIYSSKGGILKTSFCHELARISALNNVKTIVIGLDLQQSVTDCFRARKNNYATKEEIDNKHLEEIAIEEEGLYEVLVEKKDISKIIKKTDIPTLSYIPENSNLRFLIQKDDPLDGHFLFKEQLIPKLKEFDLILFDNSPSFNGLVHNSIECSNIIVSPFGCDAHSMRAFDFHIDFMQRCFKRKANSSIDDLIVIPTRLKNTKVSRGVKAHYNAHFQKICLYNSIPENTVSEEASLFGLSTIEHRPKSKIGDEIIDCIIELYERIVEKDLSEKEDIINA